MAKKNSKRGAKKGQARGPMIPRTEEQFKNDINVLLNRSVKLIDQYANMSRKRIYAEIGTEIKHKSFLVAMDILRTHIDKTQNKIFGSDVVLNINIDDYLKKTDEEQPENEG